jgi:hypothetical protein
VAVAVTLIATIGVLPYIALQLQAVSTTFAALAGPISLEPQSGGPVLYDTAFIVALMMAVFTILFGVRHVQASEQHRGMMLAIAFESLVKVFALLAVGPFVIWGLFDGPGDLAAAIDRIPNVDHLISFFPTANWAMITMLAGLAFLCLPRQFHVAVVEADHPNSLRMARWLFPLYMLLINIFVVPIALAGLALLPAGSDPDLFVLSLPISGDAGGFRFSSSSADCPPHQHGGGRLHGAQRHGRQRAGDALAAAQSGRGRRAASAGAPCWCDACLSSPSCWPPMPIIAPSPACCRSPPSAWCRSAQWRTSHRRCCWPLLRRTHRFGVIAPWSAASCYGSAPSCGRRCIAASR